MNCIITAGPTFEPLDQVRRLTNFSTGQLGSDLAAFLTAQGHRVRLLRGYYAVYGGIPQADIVPFTTTDDLRARLEQLAQEPIDAVFHAAAVSDFRFGRVFARSSTGELEEVSAGKFSTRQGALLAELLPTAKIISELRHWFPKAWLVGWKYEVDGSRPDAIQKGLDQMKACRTDACVVNGPAYGPGYAVLTANEHCQHVAEASDLFETLAELCGRA